MSKPYAEQVSALADNELPSEELDLLTRRLADDEDARGSLARYAVIREALHRNLPDQVEPDLAERIAREIAEEPGHTAGVRRSLPKRRWVQSLGGFAVAASVAVVAITLWPQQQQPGGGEPTAESPGLSGSDGAAAGGAQQVSADAIQWERLDSDIQERLREYSVSPEQEFRPQLEILSRPVGVSAVRSREE